MRPQFAKSALRFMLAHETKYRNAPGEKTKTKYTAAKPTKGDYPEMEEKLAQWIREIRQLGIPVESSMLSDEGLAILTELYPNAAEKFKFSRGWRDAFMIRFNFSLRRTTNKSDPTGASCTVVHLFLPESANSHVIQALAGM